jgi:hypothetical protein
MDGAYAGDIDEAEQPWNADGNPGYSDGIEASVAPDHDEGMHGDRLNRSFIDNW